MKNILSKEEINTIHKLCKQYKIKNYTINPDGSIDVNGDVNLNNKKLYTIPINFNKVLGSFYCSFNFITSLKGLPKNIGGDLYCNDNDLTTLEYAPVSIKGDFFYYFNPLPSHFKRIIDKLTPKEIIVFNKYQHVLRMWDGGYDQEVVIELVEEIKDGLQ